MRVLSPVFRRLKAFSPRFAVGNAPPLKAGLRTSWKLLFCSRFIGIDREMFCGDFRLSAGR
jgi:hypothetical protein